MMIIEERQIAFDQCWALKGYLSLDIWCLSSPRHVSYSQQLVDLLWEQQQLVHVPKPNYPREQSLQWSHLDRTWSRTVLFLHKTEGNIIFRETGRNTKPEYICCSVLNPQTSGRECLCIVVVSPFNSNLIIQIFPTIQEENDWVM